MNHGIDPTLLFNKSEVSEIVRKFTKNKELTDIVGWRGAFLNTQAELFLTGKLHLNTTIIPEQSNNHFSEGTNNE